MRNIREAGITRLALIAVIAMFGLTYLATRIPPVVAAAETIDADAQASVVAIMADGAYAGSGVVVTKDGLVATSCDIANLRLTHGKSLVIPSAIPRAASVAALDCKNGIALLQMRGVVPPTARLEENVSKRRAKLLYAERGENDALVTSETLRHMPGMAATAVFDRGTGTLVAIRVHRADGTAHIRTAEDIRTLIKNAAP